MSNTEAKNIWPADESALRELNRSVVKDYMSRRGEGRLTRYELFVENGSAGLWTNDTMEPIVSRGKDTLKRHGAWSLKCFPDWEWAHVQIFETQDPNYFIVECDGQGAINFPGYEPGHYENHFFHTFYLSNGKITEQREFMNPYKQMKALGIPITPIKRGGIPLD